MSKKSFYGVGFNSKGKHKTNTLTYNTWCRMIARCYCAKLHAKQPTYIGCTVDDRWHDFQDFAEWVEGHEYSNHGYQLDKDLLLPGNKVYAPERCVFVPRQLNSLLTSCASARGGLPQGVSLHKTSGRYQAQIRLNGKQEHLGYFDCPNEAYKAYKVAKEAHVKEKALEWQDGIADDVFQALMNWTLDN